MFLGDIMPSYKDKNDQKGNLRKVKGDSKNTSSSRQKHEIPRFDLAEEILAEQRKITQARRTPPPERAAIRRKAPSSTRQEPASKKDEPPLLSSDSKTRGQEKQIRSIGYATQQPTPLLSEQQQIIAEIVARDIEKLCGSQSMNCRFPTRRTSPIVE